MFFSLKFHHCWPPPGKIHCWPPPGKYPSDVHVWNPFGTIFCRPAYQRGRLIRRELAWPCKSKFAESAWRGKWITVSDFLGSVRKTRSITSAGFTFSGSTRKACSIIRIFFTCFLYGDMMPMSLAVTRSSLSNTLTYCTTWMTSAALKNDGESGSRSSLPCGRNTVQSNMGP